MSENLFFKNAGPFTIKKITSICDSKTDFIGNKSIKINQITDLYKAKEKDITFLNSEKYKYQSFPLPSP